MTTTDVAGLFMLDFQHIVNQLDRARSAEIRRFVSNYPPVDIIRKDDNWVIQIALAGFSAADVEITTDSNHLIVKSRKAKDEAEDPVVGEYLHRGISKRSFERRWQLGEHMEVIGAAFENGLLTIGITRNVPEKEAQKVIPIGKSTKTIQDKLLAVG